MKSQSRNIKLNLNATFVIALVASINFACDKKNNSEAKIEDTEQQTENVTAEPVKPNAVIPNPVKPVTQPPTSPKAQEPAPTPAPVTDAPATAALPDDGKFLMLTDLDAPTGYELNSVEGDKVGDSLNANSFFLNSYLRLPAGSDDPNDCIQVPATVKWVANKESAKIGYTLDISECEQKKDTENNYTKYSQVLKAYTFVTCSGADLSVLNGKSIREPFDFSKCAEFTNRAEIRIDLNTESLDANGDQVIMKLSNVNFYGSEGLGSCKSKMNQGIENVSDGCVQASRTAVSFTVLSQDLVMVESKTYDTEKLASKGIVNDITDPLNTWSHAGSISVQKNDWTGSVNYAGGKVNPTYSLKNATSGEERTGTVTQAIAN